MANLTQTAANVGLTDDGLATTLLTGLAGEALTQGQPVYLNGSYYKCDADAGQPNAVAKGIVLTPGATGETVVIAPTGTTIDVGATLTVGETYVVSATAGAIAPIGDLTTGDYVTILGVAKAAGKLVLDINATGTPKP